MSIKEGTLHMQPPGRWAICCPGHEPVEIAPGDAFLIEVPGRREGDLSPTRMRCRDFDVGIRSWYCEPPYLLGEGMRAAIGEPG